ncbi:MAG TPA: cache domain-containing protein, partial [Bacteroidia bacterium]|nr:cache domain-containing protein [Bacteroidia bacterium]
SYLLDHLSGDIKFLSSLPQIKRTDSNSIIYLKEFLEVFKSPVISNAFITDSGGHILYATGNTPGWIMKYTIDAASPEFSKHFYTGVIRDEETQNNSEIYFLIKIPVAGSSSNEIKGYLGYLINFNLLVELYIKPLKLSKEDFAWIIDSNGRLIYHPHHDEMLFRSINNTAQKKLEDLKNNFDSWKETSVNADFPKNTVN